MAESIPMKPLLSDRLSIGELYGPAMDIASQAEADEYFELLVERNLRVNAGHGRAAAESVERQNLDYYAGYFSNETRERVEKLFRTAHPFFGALAVNGPPTVETAYNIGAAIGQAMRIAGRGTDEDR